jgi:hypothetical protein
VAEPPARGVLRRAAAAAVYVLKDGAKPVLFANGSHGSEEARWIEAGATYEFSLYSSPGRHTRLARIFVTRLKQ